MIRSNLHITKGIALVLVVLGSLACSSSGGGKDSKTLPVLSLEEPNIRIERFEDNRELSKKGPVILKKKDGKQLSFAEAKKAGFLAIKEFPAHGEWVEYTREKITGDDLRVATFVISTYEQGNYVEGKREGLWKRFDYKTKKLIGEFEFANGVRHGLAKIYSLQGALISEEEFVEGKRHGKSYLKSPQDGHFIEEGQFKDGEKHGKWTFFHAGKGTVRQTVHYVNGLLEGEETNYYDNGTSISSQGMNRNDARTGIWKLFYEDGTLKAEGSYRGLSQEEIKKAMDDAAKRNDTGFRLVKFEQNGVWKEYYPNGQLFGTGPRKKTREGRWTIYYNDGKVRYIGDLTKEVIFTTAQIFDRTTGNKIGEGKLFFSIVSIDEETKDLKDSYRPDIPFTYYHPNGKKRFEIQSADLAIEYDENGKELGRGGSDAQGRKNGCWKEGGKVTYYMLGIARHNMTAHQCGGR